MGEHFENVHLNLLESGRIMDRVSVGGGGSTPCHFCLSAVLRFSNFCIKKSHNSFSQNSKLSS